MSWITLTAFAAVLAVAARNATLLSARVDELWREAPDKSRADIIMMAARERMSPVLKAALITALILVPPAVLGGAIGQGVIGPMAIIIIGGLITTTLVGLFALPLLMLGFGPRTAPEEWSSVYEPEVPVMPVTQEKVEVK